MSHLPLEHRTRAAFSHSVSPLWLRGAGKLAHLKAEWSRETGHSQQGSVSPSSLEEQRGRLPGQSLAASWIEWVLRPQIWSLGPHRGEIPVG